MAAICAQLAEVLAREVECTQELAAALRANHEVFAGKDPAAIERAAHAIKSLVDRVEAVERERVALLQGGGVAAGPVAMEELAVQCGDTVRDNWQQLLAVAKQCRALNQINAGVVEIGRRHAVKALNILRGQPAAAETYGPRGRAPAGYASSRPLAKA